MGNKREKTKTESNAEKDISKACSVVGEDKTHLVHPLPLLLLGVAVVVRRVLAGAARDLGSDLEQDAAHARVVVAAHGRVARVHHVRHITAGNGSNHVGLVKDVHDHGTGAVGACMLSKVVRARELLTALVAVEWLVMGMQRAVVTLEVLLAAEAAVAQVTGENLGRVLSQRLLAATAVGGDRGSDALSALIILGSGRLARDSDGRLLGRSIGVLASSLSGSGLSVVSSRLGIRLRNSGHGEEAARRGALALAGVRRLGALVRGLPRVEELNLRVGSNRRAGTRAQAQVGRGNARGRRELSAQVHQGVDKVVVRLQVRELLKNRQVARDEVGRDRGRRDSRRRRRGLSLQVEVVINISSRAERGVDGRERGREAALAAADRQVAGIAEVVVLVRRDGASVGSRRGRQRRASRDRQQIASQSCGRDKSAGGSRALGGL